MLKLKNLFTIFVDKFADTQLCLAHSNNYLAELRSSSEIFLIWDVAKK